MPSGAKRWYFRFYWRNKRRRLGLGQWPAVGLAGAAIGSAAHAIPRSLRICRTIRITSPRKRVLNADVLPQWSDRDARTITSREVIELLDKIVDRGSPVMANRTANILSQCSCTAFTAQRFPIRRSNSCTAREAPRRPPNARSGETESRRFC
jgi:hypothetical protein